MFKQVIISLPIQKIMQFKSEIKWYNGHAISEVINCASWWINYKCDNEIQWQALTLSHDLIALILEPMSLCTISFMTVSLALAKNTTSLRKSTVLMFTMLLLYEDCADFTGTSPSKISSENNLNSTASKPLKVSQTPLIRDTDKQHTWTDKQTKYLQLSFSTILELTR